MRPKPTTPSVLPQNVRAAELIEVPALPRLRLDHLDAFEQAPRDGENQHPGEIGGGLVEDAGRVRRDDAVARAGGYVDIVEANRDRGGQLQIGRFRQQLLVHLFGEQADEAVFIGHARKKLGARDAFGVGPILHGEVVVEQVAHGLEERASGKQFWLGH